jgi:hypothetical protein
MRYAAAFLSVFLAFPQGAAAQAGNTVPFRQVQNMILIDAEVERHRVTLLLDTGANNTLVSVDFGTATQHIKAMKAAGQVGAEGDYVRAKVDLRISSHHWIDQDVLLVNTSDLSKRMGVKIDGLIGEDILQEFASVRIDYRSKTIELSR